jgi:hypothetical protein
MVAVQVVAPRVRLPVLDRAAEAADGFLSVQMLHFRYLDLAGVLSEEIPRFLTRPLAAELVLTRQELELAEAVFMAAAVVLVAAGQGVLVFMVAVAGQEHRELLSLAETGEYLLQPVAFLQLDSHLVVAVAPTILSADKQVLVVKFVYGFKRLLK